MRPDEYVMLSPPCDGFTEPMPSAYRHRIFIAGGSGIAPFRAMVAEALTAPSRIPLTLIFSARASRELLFADEFRRYAGSGRVSLHMSTTREHTSADNVVDGRIDRPRLRAVIANPQRSECFVCGPQTMIHDVTALLLSIGVPKDRIHWDKLMRGRLASC